MYRRPRGCKDFSCTLDTGRVRSLDSLLVATDAMLLALMEIAD